jgi:hypothetical protein
MADAIVIPGRMFGPAAPLLMYSGLVTERRGATVHRHWWSQEPPDFAKREIEDWVCGEVAPILDRVDGAPVLIGKSLGANAARLATLRSLPAVWLTPVLRFMPWVVEALEGATAPFLLVGGSADRSWDADLAHRLTPHVLSVDAADHGMCVPGPPRASIEVLGRVVDAVEAFLDAIGWPYGQKAEILDGARS